MKIIFKTVLLGVALSTLAGCGGYSSKVEDLVETCWAPRIKSQNGLSDIKLGEVKVLEEELSAADKQNGFTWAASVLIKYSYRESADGPWRDGSRMPSASVREGKLRLERADGITCEADA